MHYYIFEKVTQNSQHFCPGEIYPYVLKNTHNCPKNGLGFFGRSLVLDRKYFDFELWPDSLPLVKYEFDFWTYPKKTKWIKYDVNIVNNTKHKSQIANI